MKAYSGHGIYDEKLARKRRKEKHPNPCGAYLRSDHTWQLEQNSFFARECCIAEGTFEYRIWEGSLEDYLDGKPYIVASV